VGGGDGRSDSTVCTWVSSSRLVASLGPLATVTVGSSVTLLANRVKARCATGNLTFCASWRTAPRQEVMVLPPKRPVVPRATLVGPRLLSACDNLTVRSDWLAGGLGCPLWSS
jgi:hypothetical protein